MSEPTTNADGSTTVTNADGSVTITNADGTVRTESAVSAPVLRPTITISITADTFDNVKTELANLVAKFNALDGTGNYNENAVLANNGRSNLTYRLTTPYN